MNINTEANLMGKEDLSGYRMTNGLYVDPNDSEDDDEDHEYSHNHDEKARRFPRSVSSPTMGPLRKALSPTVEAPPSIKGDMTLSLKSPNATPNLPDAIMAAFQRLNPKSPNSSQSDMERKMSVSGAEMTSPSVFVNPLLLPPTFASLSMCENCKVEVGTLLSKPRHHCRNCGGTFCQPCSSKSSIIPYESLMNKGEFRVCDCCYLKIREFQAQTATTQCTWNGLQPMSEEVFLEKYNLPGTLTPMVIFSCCYFPDCVPYYGHLYLTRGHICFYAYKKDLSPIMIPFDDITGVVKPEFYFINALQLKTKEKSWFFAEFNGHRETCCMRLDQLINAYRQPQPEVEHTPELLKEMASQRRLSYLTLNRRNTTIKEDEDFVPLPPDETLVKMTKILDCELQSDLKNLYEALFSNTKGKEFYNKVMVSTKDIDITIGDWLPIAECPKDAMSALCVSKEPFSFYRKVESKHPPKVTFPGLPPFAECTRYQLCRHEGTSHDGDETHWTRFVLAETMRMKKIPYADYFEIETRWVFTRDGGKFCHAEVGIIVHFIKSTWFNNQIISSTISESKEAFETWSNHAINELRLQSSAAITPPKQTSTGARSLSSPTKKANTPKDVPLESNTTQSFNSVNPRLSIANTIMDHPLWAVSILIALYYLYTLHSINRTMQEVLKRTNSIEKVMSRVAEPEKLGELLDAFLRSNRL